MMLRESLQAPWVQIWMDASGSHGYEAVWDKMECKVEGSNHQSFQRLPSIAARNCFPYGGSCSVGSIMGRISSAAPLRQFGCGCPGKREWGSHDISGHKLGVFFALVPQAQLWTGHAWFQGVWQRGWGYKVIGGQMLA